MKKRLFRIGNPFVLCLSTALWMCASVGEALPKKSVVQISSFSTSVAHQSEEVKHNLALACSKLNGLRIASGGVFNFSDVVGEGSAANGFLDGAVLYRDALVSEPGGGLCQVSSTLFNALLLAGFGIVERHRHYQPVTYVPLGLDATIKYGKKNLRMKNMSGQDVVIGAVSGDASCNIVVYGGQPPMFTYSMETEEDELSLPLGDFSEREMVRPGIEVYVYRKKFKDGKLVENFLLYKDFYPPVKLQ